MVDSVVIGNEAYNRLYAKMKSVNTLLAWGHARVIENLLGKRYQMNPPPVKAISDQFAASKSVIEKALMAQGKELQLVQRHKAEEDIAVAAASILARDEFVKGLAKLEKQFEMKLPKGASAAVDAAAKKFVEERGAGESGENFQAAFPHGAARARFAGAAEDGVAEIILLRRLAAQPHAAAGGLKSGGDLSFPIGGHRWQSGGHDIPDTGQARRVSGHPIPVGGHCSRDGGQAIRLGGQARPVSGQRIPAGGHDISASGQTIRLGGQRIPASGQGLRFCFHLETRHL